jgi:tRNA threonylcarbamoyl adenosine modification protein YeaZ
VKTSGAFFMKILALEFSSSQRSVAVLDSTERVSEVVETGAGANAPLVMVEEALRRAMLEREQIECVAVGLGPGSYSGIRSAIALAQGWQLARKVKLLGISSAECIAAEAETDGVTGQVSVIIDAQREEFYLATYELRENGHREVEPLRIVTRKELERKGGCGSILIGPEVMRWFAGGKIAFPRAATLARLALNYGEFVAGEKLEPIYLRETKFVKAPPPRVIS